MTYNVFGGTLSLTQSINQLPHHAHNKTTTMQYETNRNKSMHSEIGPS